MNAAERKPPTPLRAAGARRKPLPQHHSKHPHVCRCGKTVKGNAFYVHARSCAKGKDIPAGTGRFDRGVRLVAPGMTAIVNAIGKNVEKALTGIKLTVLVKLDDDTVKALAKELRKAP